MIKIVCPYCNGRQYVGMVFQDTTEALTECPLCKAKGTVSKIKYWLYILKG